MYLNCLSRTARIASVIPSKRSTAPWMYVRLPLALCLPKKAWPCMCLGGVIPVKESKVGAKSTKLISCLSHDPAFC